MRHPILGLLVVAAAGIAFYKKYSITPEHTTLTSEPKMREYVKIHYGPANLVDTEKGNTYISYIFRDRASGFTYKVSSVSSAVQADGTTIAYHESKISTFEENYLGWMEQQMQETIAECEEKNAPFCRMRFQADAPDKMMIQITIEKEEGAKEAVEAYGKKLVTLDIRKRYQYILLKRYGDEKVFGRLQLDTLTYEAIDAEE